MFIIFLILNLGNLLDRFSVTRIELKEDSAFTHHYPDRKVLECVSERSH